jgi:nitroimidazol reductase NimA-like FMN-containing flavoprotein (pyridoxamine 5'-phosphate oxidase superfamily)
MPRDYAAQPPNRVRRADREIRDEGWMHAFLHRAPMAALAMASAAGQPFINSNLFAYDEANHCIYMHTARVGRTRVTVRQNEQVCLSVSEMGRLLPAAEAVEFSVEYAGVVVFGTAHVVTEAQEAARALQLLLDKYFPHLHAGRDYRPATAAELQRTTVYRITIESWSGKRKQVAADFPGAFHWRPGHAGG